MESTPPCQEFIDEEGNISPEEAEGLAEAEFLIKDVAGDKSVGEYRTRVAAHQQKVGPLGYFRSIFSRSSDDDEDEYSFADVPTNLR